MKTRTLMCVMTVLSMNLCGCAQMPAADTENEPAPPERPVTSGDLDALLRGAAAWQMISSSMLVGGFGEHVEFVSVMPGAADACVALDTDDAWLALIDGTVILGGVIDDLNSTRMCTIDMAADAAPCSNDAIECELSDPDGSVRFDAVQDDLVRVDLLRIPACPAPAATLEALGEWALFSAHPIALSLVRDPAVIGGGAVIAGNGARTNITAIAVGIQNDEVVGCLGTARPKGTVELTAAGLSVDLQVQGDDGSQCTVTFSGARVYCAEADPIEIGESGSPRHTVRFEGSGQWTRDGAQSGVIPVLYLSYEAPSTQQ